jgi:hypothetical protein
MIHIEALNFEQRRAIVNAGNLDDPSLLLAAIEHEPVLDEITRVPLFIVGVVEIAKQKRSIPQSRYGIIRELVESVERNPEHATGLRDGVCKGRYRDYLQAIAVMMCRKGSTTLPADEVSGILGACSNRLIQDGILGRTPDAQSVIDCLVSHHVLVGTQTQSGRNFRFVHQQFQE